MALQQLTGSITGRVTVTPSGTVTPVISSGILAQIGTVNGKGETQETIAAGTAIKTLFDIAGINWGILAKAHLIQLQCRSAVDDTPRSATVTITNVATATYALKSTDFLYVNGSDPDITKVQVTVLDDGIDTVVKLVAAGV